MALASAQPLPVPPIPKSLAAPRFNVRLIVGLLILASAILGLVAVYRTAQPHTVDVLRAAHDLHPGQLLQLEDLQVVAEALPEDVAARLVTAAERSSLPGRRLAQPLYAGDLVSRRQVEPATRRLGPDERLYALSIPSETVAGLHLQSADRVEIVVTANKSRPEQAETHVVLPTVTIFSVGAQDTSIGFAAGAASDRGANGKSSTIVLRTDDAGYQALAKARQIGVLDLALVGAGESETSP